MSENHFRTLRNKQQQKEAIQIRQFLQAIFDLISQKKVYFWKDNNLWYLNDQTVIFLNTI